MSKKELHQTGIVITRPSHQTGEIKALVNEHQGHPIEFPLLEIKSKSQNEIFQNIVLKLDDYDWAIFISSNAVQFGMPVVKQAFHTLPKLTQFAAIGPSPASGKSPRFQQRSCRDPPTSRETARAVIARQGSRPPAVPPP